MSLERSILRFLQSADLPVLPQIYFRLLEITDQADASAQDLAKTILEDQVMTGKVLSIANTPFYGIGQKVSTITKAVMVLGFNTIRSVVTMASVAESLAERFSGEGFQAIWLHSLGCGVAARGLAAKVGVDPEKAIIMGLLHDCGRLFMHHCYPDESAQVDREVEKGADVLAAEREVFGCTHEEIGGHVVRAWQLPVEFVSTTTAHHEPWSDRVPHGRERRLVHLANRMSWHVFGRAGVPSPGHHKEQPNLFRFAQEEFGLGEKAIRAVMAEMAQQVQEIVDSLALGIRVPTELAEPEDEATRRGAQETETLKLVKSAEKMSRQLAFLNEISTLAVSGAVKLDELIQAIIEGIYRGIGFDRVFLLLKDRDKRIVRGTMGLGMDAPRLAPRLQASLTDRAPGLIARALATGSAYNVLDARSPLFSHLPPLEVGGHLGTDAFALVPLAVGSEAIGCVLVDNAHSREPVTDQDVDSIRTFVNLANLTLSHEKARKALGG